MSKKYPVPRFLDNRVSQEKYLSWLRSQARRHLARDRKRGNATATNEEYLLAIHQAVRQSEGRDAYTGDDLHWELICQYNNKESKDRKRAYKREFAMLPTVDHVGDGTGRADFRICAWKTNDAKNDLSLDEFLDLCQAVVQHAEKALSRK